MTQIALAPATVRLARPQRRGQEAQRRGMEGQRSGQEELRGRQGLRLTRRGRVLLVRIPLFLAALLAVVGVGFTLLAPAEAGTTSQGDGLTTVTVMQGENLWDIAREVAPQRNTGDVVEEIRELNHLSSTLQAGQSLVVPDRE